MSIEDKDRIDFIGTRKSTGEIVLTISDHLNWDDSYSHLLMLQDKLNAYIQFIESGQILSDYPQSKGKRIVIEIVSKFEYNDIGNEFILKAIEFLKSIDVELVQKVPKD